MTVVAPAPAPGPAVADGLILLDRTSSNVRKGKDLCYEIFMVIGVHIMVFCISVLGNSEVPFSYPGNNHLHNPLSSDIG